MSEKTFRDKYRVQLAWSNDAVSDEVLIRKALLSANFVIILDACVEFGANSIFLEWDLLKSNAKEDPDFAKEFRAILPLTSSILLNIDKGIRGAS